MIIINYSYCFHFRLLSTPCAYCYVYFVTWICWIFYYTLLNFELCLISTVNLSLIFQRELDYYYLRIGQKINPNAMTTRPWINDQHNHKNIAFTNFVILRLTFLLRVFVSINYVCDRLFLSVVLCFCLCVSMCVSMCDLQQNPKFYCIFCFWFLEKSKIW